MTQSTLKDVARKAGVSEATVSFVMNNRFPTRIPESTRRKVRAAMHSLRYRPNRLARGLAGGATQTLGILYDGSTSVLMSDRFSVQLFAGILETSSKQGWRTHVVSLDDRARPREAPFVRGEVDGVMYLAAKSPPALRACEAQDLPVVLINPDFAPPQRTAAVLIDDRAAVDALVGHFHDIGHRRFVFISGFLEAFSIVPRSFAERRSGFEESMRKRGLPVFAARDFCFSPAGNSHRVIEQGMELWRHIQSRHPDVTAVICANDLIAQAMLVSARHSRIHIPRDCSLAGIDDILHDVWQDSLMTTVRVPAEQMGAKAVELMTGLIQRAEIPEMHAVIFGELKIRATTGPVRAMKRR